MLIKPNPIPLPDALSLAHSQKVFEFIVEKINQTPNQRITFAEFMQLALYAPGLGYYVAGNQKFGVEGDFVTAPEISPLFSQCLARQCAEIIELVGENADILEFGAGSGVMAADILLYLETIKNLPNRYLILEVSPELTARQRQTLKQKCPHLINRVAWLTALPQRNFNGIIIANEVLDAMPVHRFHIENNQIEEYYITVNKNEFCWQLAEPSSKELESAISHIQREYLEIGNVYTSEICLLHSAWLRSLSAMLTTGVILLIDYGYLASEYYHPQRNQGTLTCFFRHHRHNDPLLFPGIQDITAHVNFSQLLTEAENCDLDVVGYTPQANFLINCGLGQLQQQIQDPVELININQQIKLLTLPTEMGELFKVLALSRKIEQELVGFKSLTGINNWEKS